ncbi:hypothetical protein [Candidatus Symbiothrix dinenymphae]|uniref:hypothetical protein n=1 Tax=Candidatus Symbiothrix dinenymphae TaxID=467085 RepID=UPI0007037650|nr:hypothetical protein [Candidatus Symbiothrix dinenymphae]
METTFDKFINSDPQERELFDKEYENFSLSECVLEKREKESISGNIFTPKANIVPTIRKIRTKKVYAYT